MYLTTKLANEIATTVGEQDYVHRYTVSTSQRLFQMVSVFAKYVVAVSLLCGILVSLSAGLVFWFRSRAGLESDRRRRRDDADCPSPTSTADGYDEAEADMGVGGGGLMQRVGVWWWGKDGRPSRSAAVGRGGVVCGGCWRRGFPGHVVDGRLVYCIPEVGGDQTASMTRVV